MTHVLSAWLEKAKRQQFAIGAFNAATYEVIKGIAQAAATQSSPAIVAASSGQMEYLGMENFLAIVNNLAVQMDAPLFVNLDHGKEIELVEKAIENGFDMVHFDGSDLPLEENLAAAARLTKLAHRHEVLIEVEFEKIQRSSEAYLEETAAQVQVDGEMTDPVAAKKRMAEVGADLLAVSVGNLHGVYRTPEEINIELIDELSGSLPCYLVLHGGSGINPDQLAKAVAGGVQKVNVNTELRLTFRQTLENVLKGSDELKEYKYLPPAIAAVQKVVEEKMRLFGSAQQKEASDGEEPVIDIPKLQVDSDPRV